MATTTRAVLAWSAAVAAAGMAGCGKNAAAPQGGMPPGTPVMAAVAVSETVPVYIDEIGHTSPVATVSVVPQVAGKVMERPFQDGAELRRGQVLFRIDPRPFQAVLDQAQGQLKKDQAAKGSADWNVGQDTAALTSKAISEQQLHNDTAARDSAMGAIAVDQAMIAQAQLNLEYATITSPIDGLAGQRLVDVGNVVNGGGQMAGTSLLVINKIDPIYADFTVTEAELARVQQYMAKGTLNVRVQTPADVQQQAGAEAAAHMAAMGGPPGGGGPPGAGGPPTSRPMSAPAVAAVGRTGKLIFLDNAVQDASGTVRLRAEVPNGDHHFWPGQFVNVRLVLTEQPAVLIPATAKQISQQGLFVYKVTPSVNSPTKVIAAMQPVTVGQQHGDQVVIETGLSAGDSVVSSGFTLLQPDAPIMVINAGPPGKTPPPTAPPVGPGTLKSPNSQGQPKGGPQASAAGGNAEGGHL